MTTACAVLLSWAVQLTGMPDPGECPEVHQVPGSILSEVACRGECPIYGLYLHGVIYLHQGLDMSTPYGRSVLVHEITHHLQDKAGLIPAADCPSHVRLERYAYGVQREYLRRNGSAALVGMTAGGCH